MSKFLAFDSHACTICKHYRGDGTCEAYPGGIPKSIINGFTWYPIRLREQPNPVDTGNDHRFPIDGDRGIAFETGEPADTAYREAWWGKDKSKWPYKPK